MVYVLSYSYVFVSRYRLKKVLHENEAEIATQFIHRNLFDKRINVIQITDKTLGKSILWKAPRLAKKSHDI